MAPIPEPEGAVLEAFEREATVTSPAECREVWLAQLPYFSPRPERAAPMLEDVVFRPEVHHPRDWGELDALAALATTQIPVLAIGAGKDPAFPFALAERIAATAPNGRALLLEQCGHFPFAEDPTRYWGEIAAWLAQTAPRARR
jgi:pimeloyl-ACP methyl ester carboxylesterase